MWATFAYSGDHFDAFLMACADARAGSSQYNVARGHSYTVQPRYRSFDDYRKRAELRERLVWGRDEIPPGFSELISVVDGD